MNDPREMARLFTELADRRDKCKELQLKVAVQNQKLLEMKPKATYYDMVLQSNKLLTITEIAKDFRMTAHELNKFLADHKIQFKTSGDLWLLYKKYAERGYTQTKTHAYVDKSGYQMTRCHTYWTQSGRLFIYELLKRNGILPTVELEDCINK